MLSRRAESDALNVYVRINEYRSALQENRIFSEHQTRRRPFGVAARLWPADRGWLVFETIWKAQLQLEAEWADLLGKKRFDDFMRSLRTVSGVEQRGGARAAQRSARGRRVKAALAK